MSDDYKVRIRIIRRPESKAPDEVNDGWIGAEFEATSGLNGDEPVREIESNIPSPVKGPTFWVPTVDGIEALKKMSSFVACKWLRDRELPHVNENFVFNADECEEIGPRIPIPKDPTP